VPVQKKVSGACIPPIVKDVAFSPLAERLRSAFWGVPA
jgi:hypothetical protein